MAEQRKGFVFDLDGVLVDTAGYHYQAWSRLARELGFMFTAEQNELLKGVSRAASLEILLKLGGIEGTAAEKSAWATQKNTWYVERISTMTPQEVLPGVVDFVTLARALGLKTAVGSASKNTPMILERTGLAGLFDAVVDGNATSTAKPDPEVFLLAAAALGLDPGACVVFEDAEAGVQAALAAGMAVVGIGAPRTLGEAHLVLRGFSGVPPDLFLKQLPRNSP